MKTKSAIEPTSLETNRGTKTPSRLAKLSRMMLAAMGVSFVSVAAVPSAHAAAPNGNYVVTSVSGQATFDGNNIDLPDQLVKKLAGQVNGVINIENKTLQLNENPYEKVISFLEDKYNFTATANVTGPSSITLAREGDIFIGRTDGRIKTSFEGRSNGQRFSGVIFNKVTAKVDGRKLKVIITYSGRALGSTFDGRVVVLAER